ncbi:hypothetical protein [Mycoplasmopsis pullorum]|uniref:Lipoprotein n=1 Tax=Mycoplasmopsis pullorum TaxID=48003 RepID=A0A1L4FR57_9BACT|nr:hypothetical protein [Mycoplasmopsis pullorum]APJ38095.1 hypothetical protein BLA55_00065 [Mycoplasmopsis pullorum]APJ38754.1 hypothetical protein BLA55_03780 [Mycoplasmopsis pullorum]APJ38793.1 hypothetical protein BLA55_04005 [Mycoplasmopsis pullorum]
MKLKKKLLLGGLGLGGLTLVATSAACGPDTKAEEIKEIVIGVDGVQKDFYNKVIEEFNKTEYHTKHGFKITILEKDVFSAKEIGTTGASDYKVVPDIFYAPEITDLASKNALTNLDKFDPSLFDTITTQLGLSDAEKQSMKEYGTVSGIERNAAKPTPEKRLYGIRHNVEGIVMASNLDYETTKNVLLSPNTNSLKELVEEGLAIVRLQDFWYGAGIMGGVFTEIAKQNSGKKDLQDLMAKILYSDGASAKSGFIIGDKYHEHFKKGVQAAMDLVFPIWQAAYLMNEEEFKQTKWAQRGITQSDLVAVIDKDMGTVQQKIWELLKAKKINFAVVGTWDVQNTQKNADTNVFVNVIKATDESAYVQQPGAWSYAINSRNNGASAERKGAISEFIKLIFKLEPYKAYFKSDSKIPYGNHMQDELKKSMTNELKEENKEFAKFYEPLGYTSADEFIDAYHSQGKVLSKAKVDYGTWDISNSNTPLDEKNIIKVDYGLDGAEFESEAWVELKNALKPVTGLRNAEAALLGIELSALVGDGQPWQVGPEIIKSEFVQAHPELIQNAEIGTLHVRKVEDYIFGANGDSGDSKEALYAKITEAIKNNTLNALYEEVKAKATEFANAAKVEVSDEVITKASELYFNNYVNNAQIRVLVEKVAPKFVLRKDGTASDVELSKATDEIAKYEKNGAINKILDVVTSRRSIEDGGLGVLTTLTERIDHSNPQFASTVWGIWNDSTFGNKVFIKETADKILAKKTETPDLDAKAEFTAAVLEQMSKLYSDKAKIMTETALQLVVTFEK